jgi:hypothetical protein
MEMNGFADNNSHLFRSQLPGSDAGDERILSDIAFYFCHGLHG